ELPSTHQVVPAFRHVTEVSPIASDRELRNLREHENVSSVKIGRTVIDAPVDEEVVPIIVARPLICVVSQNRVGVYKAFRELCLKRIVVVTPAVRIQKDILGPAEFVKEESAIILRHCFGGKPLGYAGLIAFAIRVVATEYVGPFVSNVGS